MLKVLRCTSLVLLTASLLLVAFHGVENIRADRAYRRWNQAQLTQGRPSDIEQMAPALVPDDQNFAVHPAVRDAIAGVSGAAAPVIPTALSGPALFQVWQQGREVDLAALAASLKVEDLESFLRDYDALLAGLEAAAKRPHSRLLKTYATDEIPALIGMRARTRLLCLRAIVRLRNGQPEQGLEDIRTSLRVANHLAAEPHLISQLLRLAILRLTIQPIWEGLSQHRWNDAQLQRLELDLRQVDLLASWQHAWTSESIATRHQVDQVVATPALKRMDLIFAGRPHTWWQRTGFAVLMPEGWHVRNLLSLVTYHEDQFIRPLDPTRHRIDAVQSDKVAQHWMTTRRTPYTLIVKQGDSGFAEQNRRLAFTQSIYDQARIACALERHRLQTGTLPKDLAGLETLGLPPLPLDLLTGRPYHYEPLTGGRFRLEGTGWPTPSQPSQAQAPLMNSLMESGPWAWSR